MQKNRLPKILTASLLTFLFTALPSRAADPAPTPKISPTLAEDLTTVTVPLLPNYANSKHPRLLFSPEDKPALQQKAKDNPTLWDPVLASSKRLSAIPDAATIKSGAKYWRIEQVESGALAYFITGDKTHLDKTLAWMIPHCQEKTWGTGFRDNLDLQASWYLYHLSLAYDILHDDIPEADRKIIIEGLAAHAKAIYENIDPDSPENKKNKFSFDQNHTYIPTVALATASLALLGEVPEAADWLKRAYGLMNRSRYALGTDGYYYEGYGYWFYAMHWHVRYADLMSRATGQNFLDLPILKQNWQFALQLSLPGKPFAFDIHDGSTYTGNDRPDINAKQYAIFWDLAKAAKAEGGPDADTLAGDNKTAADFYHARAPDLDYPAATFLWYCPPPNITATPFDKITPYHYFPDADVITWRSGWDENATCLLFRAGPPEGHAAAEKIKLMQDWTMNAGHVHPDVGAFYLYAKQTYLAVSTGYTAEKWTKDHNTLLVDDKGQGNDGTYHNDRGIPYETLNQTHITKQFLSKDYAFATGDIGAAYTQTKDLHLTRSLLATKNYVLIIDDMSAKEPHKLTWLVHTNAEFDLYDNKSGEDPEFYPAKFPNASLLLYPLAPGDTGGTFGPAKVIAGTAPGKGVETQRGYYAAIGMQTAAKSARFVNLMVALGKDERPPRIQSKKLDGDNITLELAWPTGKTETITLNLAWQKSDAGPATFTTK